MSDIDNPLKPFELSKAWAWRVQDEFFAQGDEEKELGIPVGMLNDRDKISRSGGEHGFIVFLVAPLLTNAVGAFPMLHECATQLATNLEEWKCLWVTDTSPSAEEAARREADVVKLRETVQTLVARKEVRQQAKRSSLMGHDRSLATAKTCTNFDSRAKTPADHLQRLSWME